MDYLDQGDPVLQPVTIHVPVPGPTVWLPPDPPEENKTPPSGGNSEPPLPGPAAGGGEVKDISDAPETPILVPEAPDVHEQEEGPKGISTPLPDASDTPPPEGLPADPMSAQEEPADHPGEETPSSILPIGESDPQGAFEESINVVEADDSCRGAHPRFDLRFPPVPADALKSMLSGTPIVCQVDVDVDGSAVAQCESEVSHLAPFLLEWAEKELESGQWEPARNELKETCPDKVTVRFEFRGAEK